MDYPYNVCAAVKQHLASLGIDQAEMARRLNVTQQAVSIQLRGRSFGSNTARKWSEAFGFNYVWLKTGSGPMLDEKIEEEAVPAVDLEAYAEILKQTAEELARETVRLKTLVFCLAEKMKKAGIPME